MNRNIKIVFVSALCLAGALLGRVNALAADGQMTSEERSKLVRYLRDSQAEFLSSVEGMSDAQWTWQSAPDRWSVGETAEHVVLAESFLFDLVQKALTSPADPNWEAKTTGKTAYLERVLPDRSHPVQAPEPIRPEHLALSRAQVIERYRELRAQTIEFAERTQLPLKEHITAGLFAQMDPLNAYHFLLYIPLHNIRHDKQITEVKATPGYPR